MYRACLKASKLLIRDFGEIEKLQVSSKGPGDFVSSADKRTEKILIEEILKANSNYGILSEEAGEINKNNKSERWIIDPIDGTTNFINGIPQFAISVAYEKNGEIISSIIFDPIKNEIFMAEKGNGAFLNNFRIRVSKKRNLKECLIVTGGPKSISKIKDTILKEYIYVSKKISSPIRKFGSAALDLANVGCGRFDGYWQQELNYWDVAAGLLIVRESGGFVDVIQNIENQPYRCNIIATNYHIHNDLRELIFKKNIE
tara:strand:+ start:113 stop:886 length:774 start_codon:yes stop_codon:yes gene_type:complete